MKKTALSSVVSILFLVSACAQGVDDLRYFPLEAGRTWVFETGQETLRVVMENGEEDGLFLLKHVDGDRVRTTLAVRMENDSLFLSEHDKKEAIEAAWIQFPLTKGAEWEFTSDKSGFMRAIVLGRERVTVPAGTFDDCVIIQMTMMEDRKAEGPKEIGQMILRFAHGVGLIRVDFIDTEEKGLMPRDPLVLKSYTKP